jgi:peptidoglycan/xylan/chitin deacetylase (PgdA/CDA1 family)
MSLKQWLQARLRYDQAERIRAVLCDILLMSGLGWLLSRRKRRGATVLIYHSVAGDGLFADNIIPENAFAEQMRFIRANYQPVPLHWISNALREGRTPDPSWVAVTFDDGYRDFLTKAMPILRQYEIPASLFVPTSILDGQELFFDEIERLVRHANDGEIAVDLGSGTLQFDVESSKKRHCAALRLALAMRELEPTHRDAGIVALRSASGPATAPGSGPYLTVDDLRELPEWVEVGSHSIGHFCLTKLEDAHLDRELSESSRLLAQIRGRDVTCLAYPFGKSWSFDARVQKAAASAGYRAALTTERGQVHAGTNPLAIPRIAGTRSLSRLRLNLGGLMI